MFIMFVHRRVPHYGKENKTENKILRNTSEDIEKMKFTRNKAMN